MNAESAVFPGSKLEEDRGETEEMREAQESSGSACKRAYLAASVPFSTNPGGNEELHPVAQLRVALVAGKNEPIFAI